MSFAEPHNTEFEGNLGRDSAQPGLDESRQELNENCQTLNEGYQGLDENRQALEESVQSLDESYHVMDASYQGLDASYQGLDARQIQLERVEAAIGSSVLILIALIATVATAFIFQFSWAWLLGCGGGWVLVVTFVIFSFIWPPISIRHIRWKLDEVGLEIQRGVFWRHMISVPLARLQHADISQGPLQRQWGLAKLIVYTAGTQHASVELEGLAYETAIMLRDHLLHQQGTGDVV